MRSVSAGCWDYLADVVVAVEYHRLFLQYTASSFCLLRLLISVLLFLIRSSSLFTHTLPSLAPSIRRLPYSVNFSILLHPSPSFSHAFSLSVSICFCLSLHFPVFQFHSSNLLSLLLLLNPAISSSCHKFPILSVFPYILSYCFRLLFLLSFHIPAFR